MSALPQNYKERGLLIQFFSNPMVGFVGTVASVIGVVLAIYFYLQGNKKRELTYYVRPVRTIVVKAEETPRLSVTYDGQQIRTDITAAQIAFWNRGHESIRKTNVLQPLIISTAGEVPILEVRISTLSRDVVGVQLDQSELERGRLSVSWDILEENDGGIVQIVFAGKPDLEITASAIIEGQREIRQLGFPGTIKPSMERYSLIWRMVRSVGLGLFAIVFLTAITGPVVGLWLRMRGIPLGRLDLVITGSYLIILVVALYLGLFGQPPTPPFGF